MGMTVFDEATAVTPEGDGRYRVSLDGRFAIVSGNGSVGAVNGGVLMACVLRAVLDTSPHPDPVATSTARSTQAMRTPPFTAPTDPLPDTMAKRSSRLTP